MDRAYNIRDKFLKLPDDVQEHFLGCMEQFSSWRPPSPPPIDPCAVIDRKFEVYILQCQSSKGSFSGVGVSKIATGDAVLIEVFDRFLRPAEAARIAAAIGGWSHLAVEYIGEGEL